MNNDDAQPLVTPDGAVIEPHAFTEWLAESWAMLDLELSEALAECITATQLHHLASTLTLTIKIDKGDGFFGELLVTPKVTSKPARPKADPQPFFPTAEGGLSRYSQDQPRLPGTTEQDMKDTTE